MDQSTTINLAEVERRRLQLEQNVSSFQKSMRYWQVWEAEYEGVKEEVEELKDEPSAEELSRISRDFGGEVVKEQEINELLGLDKSGPRTKEQIIALVSKRIEMGQQNVQTLQKQIQDVGKRLSSLPTVTIPDMQDEGGLPLAEIHEELDEDGNIISSSVSQPGRAASHILDTLRKAGVTDLNEPAKDEESSKTSENSVVKRTDSNEVTNGPSRDSDTLNELSATNGSTPPKKTVSFAGDTKPPKQVAYPKSEGLSANIPKYSMDEATHRSFTTGSRVLEVDENDNVIAALPVIPPNETPQEAEQRRDMLAYGLSEVGAVVAELDLEEGTGSEWDDDYDDDEDEDDDDEKWRSTKSQIPADYHKKMQELEKELNARMLENIGPNGEITPIMDLVENAGARRLVVRNDEEIREAVGGGKPKQDKTDEKPAKKGVRFAEKLDIAPTTTTTIGKQDVPSTDHKVMKPVVAPVAESVLERQPGAAKPQPSTEAPRKASRFKSARSGKTNVVSFPPPIQDERPVPRQPVPPTDRIVANSLVERSPSSNVNAPEPDEFDPARLQQEVAVEYHKMRNRMIQEHGGVVAQTAEDEELYGPLMEQREDGTVRKVSKFRAARLGRIGM